MKHLKEFALTIINSIVGLTLMLLALYGIAQILSYIGPITTPSEVLGHQTVIDGKKWSCTALDPATGQCGTYSKEAE